LKVQMKQAARRRNQIIESLIEIEDTPTTIQELLTFTVKACVREFKRQKDAGGIVLSGEEIEDKASTGKIGFGFFYGEDKVVEADAIETTIQAFLDGIVVVFVDNEKKESLEEKVVITEETVVTFVRLTLLTGRLW
ncbi:hypothetical protein LJC58_06360, partial [Lachnospiraceae bacterium OttesenSCG-928-D06]|nr:hypothetical protein [Lachnospiraceae bacterium OttesenSCG-928-D06]